MSDVSQSLGVGGPAAAPVRQRTAPVRLRRGLSLGGLVILGSGGSIGTGVLFSSTGMAAVAGPAMIISWAIGGAIYMFIGLSYVDMGLRYPEAGGPARFSFYTHGSATNLINAVCDLIWYLFIPAIEALAAMEGISHFDHGLLTSSGDPTTTGGLVAVALMILFVPCNYFGIGVFHRLTNVLGGAKILLYLLLGAGVLVVFFSAQSFTHYGGFTPFGGSGILAAIPLAMFSYGGARVMPDYAEEAHDPRDLKRSIPLAVGIQWALYVLFAVAFIAALGWSQLSVSTGSWAGLAKTSGNPFVLLTTNRGASGLFAIALAVGIIGPAVDGYVYQGAGSRVLMAMGRSGYVSNRMQQLSRRHQVPIWGILVLMVVGAIVAFIAAPLPNIYSLIDDSVAAGYVGFSAIPIAMLAVRRANNQPIEWTSALIAGIAFAGASLIVYWSGWPSVPYAAILIAVGALIFGLTGRVGDWRHAGWYVAYILFLLLMTWIGSVGSQNVISFNLSTAIVIAVALLVFLPWGVASRLSQPQTTAQPPVDPAAET
ncbi:MAG TPA: APC family permease [Solirubrobacteraceae bacterium]|nr:APC family permease [Solirubrobacteraceae bacterium]